MKFFGGVIKTLKNGWLDAGPQDSSQETESQALDKSTLAEQEPVPLSTGRRHFLKSSICMVLPSDTDSHWSHLSENQLTLLDCKLREIPTVTPC